MNPDSNDVFLKQTFKIFLVIFYGRKKKENINTTALPIPLHSKSR